MEFEKQPIGLEWKGRFIRKSSHEFAYLPSVEKVPSFVRADDELKPTTEIAVDRYTAYKRPGCEEVRR